MSKVLLSALILFGLTGFLGTSAEAQISRYGGWSPPKCYHAIVQPSVTFEERHYWSRANAYSNINSWNRVFAFFSSAQQAISQLAAYEGYRKTMASRSYDYATGRSLDNGVPLSIGYVCQLYAF